MSPASLFLFLVAITQDAPVSGPLTDALERRLDKFAERVEQWQSGSTVILKRIEEAQASRFAELFQEIRSLRQERDGLFNELAEFRKDRDGILGRLQHIRDEVAADREENGKRWTPIQNLVDRLTGLVWKILWLCVAVVVVVIVISAIGLFLYVRLKARLLEIAKGRLL